MKPVVVACSQFAADPGQPANNVGRMLEYARQAFRAGARIVLYPELIVTGYLAPERIAPLAFATDDPLMDKLRRGAADLGVALVFGFPERGAAGRRYNSQAFVASDGTIAGVYRKTHLWDTERVWAAPGQGSILCSMEGVVTGGWICYDTRFPELACAQASSGAELALVSTAWLGPGEQWELALRARALDGAFFVAGSDMVDPPHCMGRSMIVDPGGAVIARAAEGTEGVITAPLDPEVLVRQRRRVPLFRDRRPEAYAAPGPPAAGAVAGRGAPDT